jgi:PEP-CTERM motif
MARLVCAAAQTGTRDAGNVQLPGVPARWCTRSLVRRARPAGLYDEHEVTTMRLLLTAGLLALLPHAAWATPLAAGSPAGASVLAQAQRGLLFGGFFTLYRFEAASPAAHLATGLPAPATAPGDGPAVASPAVSLVADDVEAEAEAVDGPATEPITSGTPALVGASAAPGTFPRLPLPQASDRVWFDRSPLPQALAEVPEPSTLLLAALALVAAGSRHRRRPAVRPVRA